MTLNNKLLRILQNQSIKTPIGILYKTFSTLILPLLHEYRMLNLVHTFINNSEKFPAIFESYLSLSRFIHSYDARRKCDWHVVCLSVCLSVEHVCTVLCTVDVCNVSTLYIFLQAYYGWLKDTIMELFLFCDVWFIVFISLILFIVIYCHFTQLYLSAFQPALHAFIIKLCLSSWVCCRLRHHHELTPPCRSIQSTPPWRHQAEIKRAQIVLNRSQPGLPQSTSSASPVFGRTVNAGLKSSTMVLTGVGTTKVHAIRTGAVWSM